MLSGLLARQRGSSRKSAAYKAMHKDVLDKLARKKRDDPEFKFHKAAYEFLCRVLPKECVVFHPRNEAAEVAERKRGAAIGVVPGLPDLIVLSPLRTVCFECKVGIRKLSKAQRDCHERLEAIGIRVATVRTLNEIEHHLRIWGFKLRGGIV